MALFTGLARPGFEGVAKPTGLFLVNAHGEAIPVRQGPEFVFEAMGGGERLRSPSDLIVLVLGLFAVSLWLCFPDSDLGLASVDGGFFVPAKLF